MSKIAVFFPGVGYTIDKPLMYYSRVLAWQLGYDEKLLPYGGFPPKIPGDSGRTNNSFEIALKQSEEMLPVVFTGTDDPWVGKENSRIPELSAERGIPCHLIPGGNHSLESGDLYEDIRQMGEIMKETERFMKEKA